MEYFCLNTWKQIQHDNKTYYNDIVIYKNGNNYCTFNESAMKATCCFREHPFLLELIIIADSDHLIQLTFTSETFKFIKTNYEVISLTGNRWIVHNQHSINELSYQIWYDILSLELGFLQRRKNIIWGAANENTGSRTTRGNNSYSII